MRCVHRDRRWRRDALVQRAGIGGGGALGDHDRGAGEGRHPAPAAGGLDRRGRRAVRLLPGGADHVRRGAARQERLADRRRDRCGDGGQPVPLRHVPAHPARDQARRRPDGRCRVKPTSYQADAGMHDFIAWAEGSRATALPFRIVKLRRRGFLRLTGIAGGGLMLGLYTACKDSSTTQPAATDTDMAAMFEPSAYLKIAGDEIVIFAPNPEIGQGVKTSLPMVVAEELDAAWTDVRVEQSAIDEARYGNQMAGGSRSIPDRWNALRQAGATARAMLVAAAAQRWSVPAAECTTRESQVSHAASGRQASYFELAADAARQPVPDPAGL